MSSKYDIRAIFEKMELDLISSMHRNLKYHESEEDKEGFKWEQWQRSKLRALNKYRQENKLIMDNRIGSIEEDVNRELESNYNKGLNRISNVINKLKSLFIKNKSKNNVQDFKNHTKKISPNVVKNLSIEFPEYISEKGYINEPKENQFFNMNDKKLKALQESVNNDIKKANATVLRKMDDVYRQTIYKTHVYLQSGAVSLNQAIDMATKDFLNTGINSITYKDGKQVNIASYVEMCLRTASHRATLLGEGKKRDEYGIYTVVVSAHANTCPMCAVWQGKVLIDDVFSNPTEEYLQENKGKYKLLSEAIDADLLHVNCKHTLTTYFPGITNLPTVPDERKALERYKAEQEQRRLERYIRKWKRISIGSQDEANIEFASNKLLEYSSQLKTHLEKHPYLRRNRQKEKIHDVNINKNINLLKDSKVNAKIKETREYIKTTQPLKIEVGKQGKHILGHNNYIKGRSYLTISLEEAQEIINKYAGTGEINFNRKGEWDKKELIKVDKNIGVSINNKTGIETLTNKFKVHYSNKGTHIVPTLKEE